MTTILCIDPNPPAQKFVRLALEKTHNVVSVADGPTAVQYCAMIQPDLILIDFNLPNIDILELTLRLKMFMPKTPVLVFCDQDINEKDGMPGGIDQFLTKPVHVDTLRYTVQSFLPKPARHAAIPGPMLGNRSAVEQFERQISALNQANQRLASLNAVSALIGTSLDLEHLTDEILQQIQKTINFDSATLFLLKGNVLEAAASRGLLEYSRGLNVFQKSGQNSAWRVVGNKLPLIINDVTRSDFWEPRPELSRVRSWLGVPLIFKDRVVGVLTLDKNETGAFTDADARYTFTLAFQIAIAVENAQLFEEWESQASRLKLVNELNLEIATILDVGSLYNTLARVIGQRLYYDRVAILEINSARTALVLRACYHNQPADSCRLKINAYRHRVNTGLIGTAVKRGRPVLANQFATSETGLGGLPVQSALVVPIFVDNQVEVIINVDSLQRNKFNDQDLWTLSSIGTYTATVIENARLYHHVDTYSAKLQQTIEARNRRLEAIKKISQVISQSVDVDELLMVVGQGISQIFAGNTNSTVQVATGLINESRLVVRVIFNDKSTPAHNSSADNAIIEGNYKLNHQSAVGRVIHQSSPEVLNNVSPQKIYAENNTANFTVIASLMLAPLITAGKTIGVIMVKSSRPNAFDEDDLETLESVAFQVASAIEYARLLQKTKEMAIVDERTRLARDMHDGVAQNLAYLLIQVDRCLNMVDDGSKLEQQLESIGLLLEQNIDELRRNIFDLRPLALEGRSLFKVLENFVAEFGRRWNLQTTCSVSGRVQNVPAEVESSLYRILQEALSNARKHAQCNQVFVYLTVEAEQWIILQVEDDGKGFDLGQLQLPAKGKSHGLGLISMRERAESVGGHFLVESAHYTGTRIFAKLPLRAAFILD